MSFPKPSLKQQLATPTRLSRRSFTRRAAGTAMGILGAATLATPVAFANLNLAKPDQRHLIGAQISDLAKAIETTVDMRTAMAKHIDKTRDAPDLQLPTANAHHALFRKKLKDLTKDLKALTPQTMAQYERQQAALRLVSV